MKRSDRIAAERKAKEIPEYKKLEAELLVLKGASQEVGNLENKIKAKEGQMKMFIADAITEINRPTKVVVEEPKFNFKDIEYKIEMPKETEVLDLSDILEFGENRLNELLSTDVDEISTKESRMYKKAMSNGKD